MPGTWRSDLCASPSDRMVARAGQSDAGARDGGGGSVHGSPPTRHRESWPTQSRPGSAARNRYEHSLRAACLFGRGGLLGPARARSGLYERGRDHHRVHFVPGRRRARPVARVDAVESAEREGSGGPSSKRGYSWVARSTRATIAPRPNNTSNTITSFFMAFLPRSGRASLPHRQAPDSSGSLVGTKGSIAVTANWRTCNLNS